jgi:hypothetical protein
MIQRMGVVLCVLVGLAVLGYTFLPVSIQENSVHVKGTTASAAVEREVILRIPQDLPAGDPVLLEMTLPAVGQVAENAVFLEGRLELAGVTVIPGDVVLAPDRGGLPVSFRFLITADRAPSISGTLWLTEIFKDSAGTETRVPLLARPLEFGWRSLLGLSMPEARWLGGSLAAAGAAFAFYKRMWKPRAPKKAASISAKRVK